MTPALAVLKLALTLPSFVFAPSPFLQMGWYVGVEHEQEGSDKLQRQTFCDHIYNLFVTWQWKRQVFAKQTHIGRSFHLPDHFPPDLYPLPCVYPPGSGTTTMSLMQIRIGISIVISIDIGIYLDIHIDHLGFTTDIGIGIRITMTAVIRMSICITIGIGSANLVGTANATILATMIAWGSSPVMV